MLTIKVLGTGCPNCKRLEKNVHEAIDFLDVEAEVVKVTQPSEIVEHGVMSTPGLVVADDVVCSGRIPTKAELTTWITTALLETE